MNTMSSTITTKEQVERKRVEHLVIETSQDETEFFDADEQGAKYYASKYQTQPPLHAKNTQSMSTRNEKEKSKLDKYFKDKEKMELEPFPVEAEA